MQSAFVDVGLERDAFLYVTDFLELEDAEETDEIEKAASTGSAHPPREVHAAERGGARPEERIQRSGQRQEQKQEPRPDRSSQERQPRDRRMVVEAATEMAETTAVESGTAPGQAAQADKDNLEQGGKRWRGRRRRRGGRGSAGGAQEPRGGENGSADDDFEETSSSVASEEIHANALPSEKPQGLSSPSSVSSGASRGQTATPLFFPESRSRSTEAHRTRVLRNQRRRQPQ